ncbi:MAG: hypothetical protein RL318_335 [Fibrobacterota bacterium]
MKTRNLLLTALSIGLGLIACDKAVESQSETATPETVSLSARLTSRNATDSALLSLTKQVRVILDTGTNSAKRVDSQVVDYNTGTVKLKAIWVGSNYVLTYQGLVGGQVLWTGTVRGTATTGTNAPILKLDSTKAATLNLKSPTIQFNGDWPNTSVTVVSNNDSALHTKLYFRSHGTPEWTLFTNNAFKPAELDTIWAKDSLPNIVGSQPVDSTFKAPDTIPTKPVEKDTILTLKGLVVTPGSLSPQFDTGAHRYVLIVEDNIDSVSVTATQDDNGQTITLNDQSIISGTPKTVAVATVDSLVLIVTNQGKQVQYVIEVKHKQSPPTPSANLDTFTLASTNGKGTPWYGFAATGPWTKYENPVVLPKDTTVYFFDSLGALTSRIASMKISITTKPDTTPAPTITLSGALKSSGIEGSDWWGWATLTLGSNSGKKSELWYTLDSTSGKSATWTKLKDSAQLFKSGTVYAKELVNTVAASFRVSSKTFTVTPYTINKPTITIVDSASPGPIKLNLKSNAQGALAGRTSLWYTNDTTKRWVRHDSDTTLLIRSSTPFWVKDSLDKQVSGISKVELKVKQPKQPTVTVTPTDSIFGLGGDAKVTIKALCSEKGTVARYLLPGASKWAGDGSEASFTLTVTKTSTFYFNCSLESDFNNSSENVRRTFTLLQPPYFEKVDSSFSGSMTAKIYVDPQDVAGPTTQNVKIKYCLSTANANDCKDYQDYQETGVKIDSTLKLWAVVFSTIEPSKFSASATRVFTKNSSGFLNQMIKGDTLKFTTNAPDSARAMELYGAKSFNEDSTAKVTKSTTTTLTAEGGALKLDVNWGTVPDWAAHAGILVALDETWQAYDFSDVKSITFSYKTSDKTTLLDFGFNSYRYLGDESGTGVKRVATLNGSIAFKKVTVELADGLQFADWMITQYKDETALTWDDVKMSIKNLEFQPKPVYNAGGTTIDGAPTITLEIKDISLQLSDGTLVRFPLPISGIQSNQFP